MILVTDDMILYVENLSDYTHTKKMLGLINEFSKVAGHKVNTKNQLHFDT